MKKIFIILGCIVVFVVVAMIAIPLLVDVDKYRPQILKAANDKINGHLELGKLKLTLWGKINVEVAGLTLEDVKKRKIISVKDAAVIIPWSSIFGGKPLLTFAMQQPEVRVVKGSDGKLNVMTLMKDDGKAAASVPGSANTQATGTAEKEAEKTAAKPADDKRSELPSIVTNARLGVNLERAFLYYKDEMTNQETTLKDLNFRVKDFSLSRKTEVEISGDMQASQEKTFKISGPFQISMSADPETSGGEVTKMDVDYKVDLDDLDIQSGTMFHKAKGMKTNMQGKLNYQNGDLTISETAVRFFNAELKASGKISGLKSEPFDPNVKFNLTSNSIDLKPWNELIPMLKEYALTGSLSMGANADGLLSKLNYGADLNVKDLKAKAPQLKSEPVTNIQIKVATDKIEKIFMSMTAPGTDLNVTGSMISFAAPKLNLNVTSQSMDLDQLIIFPEAKSASVKLLKEAVAADAPVKEEDFDAMLAPLRTTPMMAAMTAVIDVQMKMIKMKNMKITDTNGRISMKNLNASIDHMTAKMMDGSMGMKMSSNLKPAAPTYTFQASMAGFDLKKATESQIEMFKNTVIGKLNFKMEGSGSSFNPTPAKKNLNARGNMKIDNAEFTSIDIAKVATEGVNKAMDAVGDKIPGIKGKRLKMNPNKSTKYEFISADFMIVGGKFTMPNFLAKSMKDGLDIKGFTEVGLLDQELNAEWELIDTWNVTDARSLDVEVSGVKVDHILAEGNDPVKIPISVKCKYTAPCPSYGKLPEHFLKVALGNAKKGATTAVKEKATEKAKDVGKKLLKGLFK